MDEKLQDALRATKGVLVQFDDAQLHDLLKAYLPAVEVPHKNSPPDDAGGDQ